MRFEIHPVGLFAVTGALAATIAVAVAFQTRPRVVVTAMLLLATMILSTSGAVLIAFHPELADARYRTFKAFFRDIRIGMTRKQVLSIMDHHYPAEGRRKRPKIQGDTAEGLGFFMNPETSSEPKCEGILLSLERGRVVSKLYSAD